MISVRFLGRLLTLPAVVVTTVVQYYTTGTALQRTNRECANSLYKNVHLAVEGHLANNFSRDDVVLFVYTPVSKLFRKFSANAMASGLRSFGERINDNTYWIHQAEGAKTALLFFHGGGYVLNVFDAQLAGIMGVHYAVLAETRSKLSIALLDYSLTCHYKNFPTQIHEAVAAYRALVAAGYDDIVVIGDSAGTNLASALVRYIAYPEEARRVFAGFLDYEWDFSPLPQPRNMIFISPWLEPCTAPTLKPGFDYTGDLGSKDTQMGDWYMEGRDIAAAAAFVQFTTTDYERDWAKVDAFNGTGRCLFVYGEREILGLGCEKFVKLITEHGGHLETHIEPGGVHDGMFYVESLDFMFEPGASRVVDGSIFDDKYAFTLVARFLDDVVQ